MRPRYLRRKAKETRRASPENMVPIKPQIAISPKRTVATPASAFSPFKSDHQLMPGLPEKTLSKSQDPKSPKRFTAALPTALSPIAKSDYSFMPESPEIGVRVRNHVVVSPSAFSPSVERLHALKPADRSPSYHPESPTMIATSPPMYQKAPNFLSNLARRTQITPGKPRSPNHETSKRKHVAIEEDLPSSSPLGPISPKRRRRSASELPQEIASTPEKIREPDVEGASSPLFINLQLEEDEPSLSEDSSENNSPLGQKLSDTLSKPGRVVNDTQAVFRDATQLIDFELVAPEGGWDDEELPGQSFDQAVSSDVPLSEDGREDNAHGIEEPTQLEDYDLSTPEGGWVVEELQSMEEFEIPNTEIYDSQPALPDTQAILRGKTPAPDFSIPEPDGGWTSLIASSSPHRPSSPRAESVSSQTEIQAQFDAWVDARAIKGISVEQVESVLRSTSMDTTLADKALRHLAKKGALPQDWKGVWTESDDEDLRSTDGRKIQRLQEKHGADCLKARWEYLDFIGDEA